MRIRPRRSRPYATEQDVAVFTILRKLLVLWREDPECLAIAVCAYEMLGYSHAVWEVRSSLDGYASIKSIPDDEAYRLIQKALYRRNRRVLRNRAEGLILALRATAEDVEAWRLHEARKSTCVIECRELSIEERLVALREKTTS